MVTTENVVQIIISDIDHIVFITFKVFWNFSKLQFVLHILAFTKSLQPVMRTMPTVVNVVQIIMSDIAPPFYIRFTVFWNFSKLLFVLQILAFTKFLLRWCAPCWLWWTLFKTSFKTCANCLYHFYSVLQLFEIAVCFADFGFYEVLTPMMRATVTMVNVVQIIISDIAHTVYIRLTFFLPFQNCCLFWTNWLLRNFYSDDAHHGNYCERCSNHDIPHCAYWVYHIYPVLKIFKIAVGLAHFGFY